MAEDDLQLDLEGVIADIDAKDSIVDLTNKVDGTNKNDQPSAEETIASLKKQLEESGQREVAAREQVTLVENQRQAEIGKATSAIDIAYKERESSVESRITSTKSSLDSVKQQLKAARTSGDIEAEIELEDRLIDERTQLNALNWEKNQLAAQKQQRADAVKNAVVEPQARQHTPREKAWIEAHPRYKSDDEYQAEVWKLDTLAKKRGIRPDTDAYYDFVNNGLEKTYPSSQGSTRASSVSTAAPPSREASSVNRVGQNGSKVRLSSEQMEAAEACGMTPAEYAQELIAIENEKLGRA